MPPRRLRGYLAGAVAARAGDEMSGPALLLLGFAATGRPATGSGLLASLTIAAAAGGDADRDDLDPAGERAVAAWARQSTGHEFAFVTQYPASARPFYHHRPAAAPALTDSFGSTRQ